MGRAMGGKANKLSRASLGAGPLGRRLLTPALLIQHNAFITDLVVARKVI